MVSREAIIAKILNASVTRNEFVNKDLDNYIYASLSQHPIKIIDKNGSDDELDYTVECPNCGRHVNYGKEMYMLSGYMYCSEKCREELLNKHENLMKKYN